MGKRPRDPVWEALHGNLQKEEVRKENRTRASP